MRKNMPRLLLAAPASNSGKTVVMLGLIRGFQKLGLNVQTYKVGPDYIDPGHHAWLTNRPSHNLDSWLVPKDRLYNFFCQTAVTDIALIEGVMGLYDGGKNGISSTADIAKLLVVPVVLIINCAAMGESAAALALGFQKYDPAVSFAGVILNNIASDNHEVMIKNALEKLNIPVLGVIRRNANLHLPERHLGLVPTSELGKVEISLLDLATTISEQLDIKGLWQVAMRACPLSFTKEKTVSSMPLPRELTIAIARDEAFSFYYSAALQSLKSRGIRLVFFSPLRDTALPMDCQAVILGGGFPEMFAEKLSANEKMRQALCDFAAIGGIIYAECGGYMYLSRELIDFSGRSFPMVGLIPARAVMKEKLQRVGYVLGRLAADCLLGPRGAKVHAHEFHFSVMEKLIDYPPAYECESMRLGKKYLAGYRSENIFASYLHVHFSGMLELVTYFLKNIEERAMGRKNE